jgi:Ca-activated chloride channel family protein
LVLVLILALPPGPGSAVRAQAGDIRRQAQAPQAQAVQPIRVSSNLVQVPVSVTDEAGQAVKNLHLEDFAVEENAQPMTIAHIGEPGQTHLDMVLVFDVSGSVFARFDFEQHAATTFLKAIFQPGDAVAILCIGSKPRLVLKRTTSLAEAFAGLEQLKPSGASTAFYDSVLEAARAIAGPPDPDTRRVQVVLSDGEDNFSEAELSDAVRGVQEADCIFYSINPGGSSIRLNKVSLRGQEGMEELASQTGGAAFLAEKTDDLPVIYDRIAAELKAQYLLSYYAPESKSKDDFRRISVRLPKHPEYRVRARLGYYASRPPIR